MEVEYEKEGKASYSIEYRTDTDIPSIPELQPVVDRTDPLNIIIGNPELRPTYRHDINLRYRNFNYDIRSGFSSWLNFNFIEKNVVSVTTIDDDLVRETRFTNIDGSMGANVGVSYNKRYKKENEELRFRVRLSGSYDKNIGFTNATRLSLNNFFNPNLRFTYLIDEVLDVNSVYELSYRSSVYDINADRNQNFTNHRAGLDLTTYWPDNLILANDISYRYLENIAPGLQYSTILWNLSLGYQFFEDDATVRLKVYDMLDQNVETRRTINDDYIRDSNNLILSRYAMLSFSYKLSSFGGSQDQPINGTLNSHRQISKIASSHI